MFVVRDTPAVRRELDKEGIGFLSPTVCVYRQRVGRKRRGTWVEEPVCAGYIFVPEYVLSIVVWEAALRMAGQPEQMFSIPRREVELLQHDTSRVREQHPKRIDDFTEGDRVRTTGSVFTDRYGRVLSVVGSVLQVLLDDMLIPITLPAHLAAKV